MARRASGEHREGIPNGRRTSGAKIGKTLGFCRAGEQRSLPEGQDYLHQQIAERAFFLYEQSGFQDGNDLEHWLEAERQIKGVRGQAA
jgi:hypothetical protein